MTPSDPTQDASRFFPKVMNLKNLREAAAHCTACPLWRDAAQTVWGEGLKRAEIMMVGEQPGDQEDRAGRPFVGPAGRLLERSMADAGIERGDVYLTNVVKHFKWERAGKRRIHKKPNLDEIRACRPWLEAELRMVRPRALLCLGATAAQALLGRSFRVTQRRGELIDSPFAEVTMATVHPSAILRSRGPSRDTEAAAFVEDLRRLAEAAGHTGR